jgi:hypothetical protein
MRLRRPLLLLVLACAVLGVAPSCAKQSAPTSFLQADDTSPVDLEFDPNALMDVPTLTDALALPTAEEIQRFLSKTPYGRSSFLSTYQSNGVRAADAIARSCDRWGINPILLLARAQVDQGLVGEQFYPQPSNRVEFAFGCGCPGAGQKCDTAYAGFDRQAECLARALRQSLDETIANGATAGGWGRDVEGRTLDGKLVVPVDESTATLYQYEPVVGSAESKDGNWVLWNVFQKYSEFLGYAGGFGPVGKQWIGDPCQADPQCAQVPNGVCVTNFPSGMCTASCSAMDPCPTFPDKAMAFCADFGGQGGYCLATCNASNPASCRAGYECKQVKQLGAGGGAYGCVPKK